MSALHLLIYTFGLAICFAAILQAAIGFIFARTVRTRLETLSIVATGTFGFVLCVKEAAALALL